MNLSDALKLLAERRTLSSEEMRHAIAEMMTGDADPVLTAGFLTALRVRGETPDEIVGAVQALRDCCARVVVNRKGLVDTCGTGGSPISTFNVSTAAAIVVSACGVPVAKHGNRSFSTNCGSADVLAALGVQLQAPRDVVVSCLAEIGLAFFFAPLWHPAMRHVASVRRTLGFRTLFNLVGPLANPATIEYQLLGAGQLSWASTLAKALEKLPIRSAAVVCSQDGLDEISLSAPTEVLWVQPEGTRSLVWTAEDFGLPRIDLEAVRVRSVEESVSMIRRVLDCQQGPALDLTLANSAAALWVAGAARSLPEGVQLARDAVHSGAAANQLERLVRCTAAAEEPAP